MKKKQNKNIFIEDVNMNTQTVFHANGNINIFPCSFELGKYSIVSGADKASQKGRMITDDNGTSVFRAYRSGSGSRYKHLMSTLHGVMKESRKHIIIRWTFSKKTSLMEVEEALKAETIEMVKWLKKHGKLAEC